ncbi:NAD-dependent succinate-semialdehyde dehydrogenase [Salipiger abyssi]|uniref:NAD-dependent succinate-semialdehyde dehydrogenase n=1 Tax=Salipiger abyssi TaxID=1250539 RepID=UPI0040583A73
MTSETTTPALLREAALVGGRWHASGADGIAVHNPASGVLIGRVPNLGAAEVAEAITRATEVQKDWAARGARARAAVLKAWHAEVIAHRDELAAILTAEQGKPLAEAAGEIDYGASYIEWYAEEARRVGGEMLAPLEPGKRMMTLKQPVGVVAAITPWNFPCAMVTRKLAPALASGCAVLLKPASQTPFTAIALALLAERAGLPPGLLSVLTGPAREIGGALTAAPEIRKLSFTGSTEVGRALYAQSAPGIKKLSLELGGNAPVIVFDDCDLDAAVEGTMQAKFRNGGQTCVCANRIFVQSGIYDAFRDRLTARVKVLKLGDGAEPGTEIGPMIDMAAVRKVLEHVDDAVSLGARLDTGGRRASELGAHFVTPALLSGVTPEMAVFREETFGPVAPLLRFDSFAEAMRLANDTPFGLASYVFSRDMARILGAMEALEFGMVGVNTGLISAAEAPFGGVKMSGLGREGGREGIEDYLETKYVCLGGLEAAPC